VPGGVPRHDVMIPKSFNKRVNKRCILRGITYEYASMSDRHGFTLILGKPTHFTSPSPEIIVGQALRPSHILCSRDIAFSEFTT